MNMYLYGYGPEGAERFILVDMGVSFPTMESSPGVELIMADPGFIQARADRLEAIFITHGHEDHLGALGLLWHRLRAPVYARRFTAALAQAKMERAGQPTDEVRQVAPWPHVVHAGPFTVGFVPIAHSIPESSALVIDTPLGRVLHSGDYKSDPTPLVGEPFDPEALRAIGDQRRAGADLRFHQRLQRPRRAVGGDADRADRRADARGRGARRRHDLRLERGAAEDARRGRARRGARGRGARAGDEHDAEGRACRRGARRLSADARRARHRHGAAREPPGARDRQPGRAAGGERAAGAGQVHGAGAAGGRHLPVLVEDDPRQRGRGRADPEPALREGRAGGRRERRALPRLGPRQPAGPGDAAGAGPAEDAGADARRAPPPVGACRARRRARHPGGGRAERDDGRALRARRRGSSSRSRPGGSISTARS